MCTFGETDQVLSESYHACTLLVPVAPTPSVQNVASTSCCSWASGKSSGESKRSSSVQINTSSQPGCNLSHHPSSSTDSDWFNLNPTLHNLFFQGDLKSQRPQRGDCSDPVQLKAVALEGRAWLAVIFRHPADQVWHLEMAWIDSNKAQHPQLLDDSCSSWSAASWILNQNLVLGYVRIVMITTSGLLCVVT